MSRKSVTTLTTGLLGGLLAIVTLGGCAGVATDAQQFKNSGKQLEAPHPEVKVVENGESKARPEDCRGIIVGPGVNQPDPFPGYGGFVGWEAPIRLKSGVWLVGFNAGYWHVSAPTVIERPWPHLDAAGDLRHENVCAEFYTCCATARLFVFTVLMRPGIRGCASSSAQPGFVRSHVQVVAEAQTKQMAPNPWKNSIAAFTHYKQDQFGVTIAKYEIVI